MFLSLSTLYIEYTSIYPSYFPPVISHLLTVRAARYYTVNTLYMMLSINLLYVALKAPTLLSDCISYVVISYVWPSCIISTLQFYISLSKSLKMDVKPNNIKT